ncbi:unnamed protein product, partial [Amoebophrya sp. A25]
LGTQHVGPHTSIEDQVTSSGRAVLVRSEKTAPLDGQIPGRGEKGRTGDGENREQYSRANQALRDAHQDAKVITQDRRGTTYLHHDEAEQELQVKDKGIFERGTSYEDQEWEQTHSHADRVAETEVVVRGAFVEPKKPRGWSASSPVREPAAVPRLLRSLPSSYTGGTQQSSIVEQLGARRTSESVATSSRSATPTVDAPSMLLILMSGVGVSLVGGMGFHVGYSKGHTDGQREERELQWTEAGSTGKMLEEEEEDEESRELGETGHSTGGTGSPSSSIRKRDAGGKPLYRGSLSPGMRGKMPGGGGSRPSGDADSDDSG